MADPTKTENYHNVPVGDMFARPIRCRVRATFSASGATVTVSSTRRQSHQATITGSAGAYSVSGLPQGADYHVAGIHMVTPGATASVFHADVTAFDAAAGTLSFITRQIAYDGSQAGAAVATSAAAAPADNAQVHISLDVETGVYS
jgi:hypothetical protein